MLGRLGLGLAGRGNVGHQRQVHEHRSLGTHFDAQLANSLEERLGLDVTHGTANFDHRDVGIAGTLDDPALDLVGNVRNHLDGRAQVVATALLAQYFLVDPPGGEVVGAAHGRGNKTLVMAQVQVGLGAIMGDKHFPMLERAHGARIDVDIGIELEHRDLQTPSLEDGGQGCRGNAFAQRRYNTTRDEDVARHEKPVD